MGRKLIFGFIIVSFFITSIGWSMLLCQNKEVMSDETIDAFKLIRFHVIANSDSPEDQAVKLQVRDAVIKYLSPKFKYCKSAQDAKAVILNEQVAIKTVANKILDEEGFTYTSDMTVGVSDFPLKSYGTLVFPAGKYEAVRIVLGKAEGKNWWCVLFPPLCFIDAANATAKTQEKVDSNKIEFRWKIVEMFKAKPAD